MFVRVIQTILFSFFSPSLLFLFFSFWPFVCLHFLLSLSLPHIFKVLSVIFCLLDLFAVFLTSFLTQTFLSPSSIPFPFFPFFFPSFSSLSLRHFSVKFLVFIFFSFSGMVFDRFSLLLFSLLSFYLFSQPTSRGFFRAISPPAPLSDLFAFSFFLSSVLYLIRIHLSFLSLFFSLSLSIFLLCYVKESIYTCQSSISLSLSLSFSFSLFLSFKTFFSLPLSLSLPLFFPEVMAVPTEQTANVHFSLLIGVRPVRVVLWDSFVLLSSFHIFFSLLLFVLKCCCFWLFCFIIHFFFSDFLLS